MDQISLIVISSQDFRIYWPGVTTNRELWIRTGQEPIITTIRRRRWRWMRWIRKDEKNKARHAMNWNPRGTRNRKDLRTHGGEASRRTWEIHKRAFLESPEDFSGPRTFRDTFRALFSGSEKCFSKRPKKPRILPIF